MIKKPLKVSGRKFKIPKMKSQLYQNLWHIGNTALRGSLYLIVSTLKKPKDLKI
jgi:hypothetical protein